jgi:hypothetical protein
MKKKAKSSPLSVHAIAGAQVVLLGVEEGASRRVLGFAIERTDHTEDHAAGTPAVSFNRGVARSQACARKFDNQPPDEVGLAELRGPDGCARVG